MKLIPLYSLMKTKLINLIEKELDKIFLGYKNKNIEIDQKIDL